MTDLNKLNVSDLQLIPTCIEKNSNTDFVINCLRLLYPNRLKFIEMYNTFFIQPINYKIPKDNGNVAFFCRNMSVEDDNSQDSYIFLGMGCFEEGFPSKYKEGKYENFVGAEYFSLSLYKNKAKIR